MANPIVNIFRGGKPVLVISEDDILVDGYLQDLEEQHGITSCRIMAVGDPAVIDHTRIAKMALYQILKRAARSGDHKSVETISGALALLEL
jgi:hypothetical protein